MRESTDDCPVEGARFLLRVPQLDKFPLADVAGVVLPQSLHGYEVGLLVLECYRWEQPLDVVVAAHPRAEERQ